MPWYLALLLTAVLLVAGLSIAHQIYGISYMGKKKIERIQDDFSLILNTPAKKASHLKEHRDWDNEFNSYIPAPELIVWDGRLMTIEEADTLHFTNEEKKRIQRYENSYEGQVVITRSRYCTCPPGIRCVCGSGKRNPRKGGYYR